MSVLDRLREVPLFSALTAEDLARVCADVEEVRLEPGAVLFREGETGDAAFVITSGEVVVAKATARGEARLAIRRENDVIGETALLRDAPRSATVRARTKVTAIRIPRSGVETLLDSSPAAARALFRTLLDRLEETRQQLRHHDRMAQLGGLVAGVAHEMNNPAAAAVRAAEQVTGSLQDLIAILEAAPEQPDALAVAPQLRSTVLPPPPPDPLAASDVELALEQWLASHGVAEPWMVAGALAPSGLTPAHLEQLTAKVPPDALPMAARLLATIGTIRRAAEEITIGLGRVSALAASLRNYAYLDRGPVNDVDVHQGLQETLTILSHQLRGIEVVQDFDPDLPRIMGRGADLNQVWTNLIVNAVDALKDAGTARPMITLRTRRVEDHVVVEVEDNGPGIPPEARGRLFDAFFTTKEPGRGTGQGLYISFQIVAFDHDGSLTFESEPGRTVFRVEVPVAGASVLASEGTAAEPQTEREDTPVEICDDLQAVENTPKPDGGCQPCIDLGDTWVHLRFCTTCGQVGCCDSSKNKHATRHARENGHPVLRTKEPDENWAWCVEHEVGIDLGPEVHPTSGP